MNETILNFAHPLTDEQLHQIQKRLGLNQSPVVLDYTVQLDLTQSLRPQWHAIFDRAIRDAGGNLAHVVAIVPPSLSVAAALCAETSCRIYGQRWQGYIWFYRDGTPPRFILGGIE